MPSVFELFGEIKADTEGFKASLRSAESLLKQFTGEFELSAKKREQLAVRLAAQEQKAEHQIFQQKQRLQQQAEQFYQKHEFNKQKLFQQSEQVKMKLAQNSEQFYQKHELNVQKITQQTELAKQKLYSQTLLARQKMAQQAYQFETKANERAIAKFEADQRRLMAAQEKTAKALASSGQPSLFTQIAGAVGIANLASSAMSMLTSKFQEGAMAVLDYSARMEQTRIAFGTLMGGAMQANKHLEDLKRFALTTPFEFEGLAEMSKRLQGVGVESQKVIPLMKDIGNIAAATGDMSSERLSGITRAITQIISKTKVSAEEMEQLAERGIPAWKLLADATGKSQAELRKMGEQGKLSADVMVLALQKISQEKFGDAMDRQSRTFSGAMSNIKDVVMQSAEKAFEPFFKKISEVAVQLADEVQKKGGDFRAVGETIGRYVVSGLGQIAVIGAGQIISEIVAEARKISTFDFGKSATFQFNIESVKGMAKGLGFEEPADIVKRSLLPALNDTQKQLQRISERAENLPNLAEKLKADAAAAEAKKLDGVIQNLGFEIRFFGDESKKAAVTQELLRSGINNLNSAQARYALTLASTLDRMKQQRELATMWQNLALQIRFFGEETEVAKVSQELMAKGVQDLTKGQAKSILQLADYYDKLKLADKSQKEYTDKLKSTRDELAKMRADAQFKIQFAEPTELNKFDNWVKNTAGGFRELSSEIAKTRQELQFLSIMDAADKRDANQKSFIKQIEEDIQDLSNVKLDAFGQKLKELAKSLGLTGFKEFGTGIDTTASVFAEKVKGFVDTLKQLSQVGAGSEAFTKVREAFANFLRTFTQNVDGKAIQIFTEDQIPNLIEKFVLLNDAIAKNQVNEKLKDVDKILKDLGITFQGLDVSKLEAFNRQLTDSAFLGALDVEAAKANMTREALIQLIQTRLQLGDVSNLTRDRILPMPPKNEWSEFWDMMKARMSDFQSGLPNIRQALAVNLGDAVQGIGDVFSNAVSRWDGTAQGFFKSVAQGFAQMAQQIISELIRIAVMQAVLKLIGSIAGAAAGGASDLSGSSSASWGTVSPASGFTSATGTPTSFTDAGRFTPILPKAGLVSGSNFMPSASTISNSITNNNQRSIVNMPITVNTSGGGQAAAQNTAYQVKNAMLKALREQEERTK